MQRNLSASFEGSVVNAMYSTESRALSKRRDSDFCRLVLAIKYQGTVWRTGISNSVWQRSFPGVMC